MAIIMRNAGRPRVVSDSAVEAAYRHRHRTAPIERLMIEAARYPFAPRVEGLAQGTRGNGSQAYAVIF